MMTIAALLDAAALLLQRTPLDRADEPTQMMWHDVRATLRDAQALEHEVGMLALQAAGDLHAVAGEAEPAWNERDRALALSVAEAIHAAVGRRA